MLSRPYAWVLPVLAVAIGCLRLVHVTADFPNDSPWMLDQAKYTDEGWWASAAVRHHLLGHFYVEGDYNPGLVAPVWPLVLAPVLHFDGVNIVAPRVLSVLFSLGAMGVVFLLVRRYAKPGTGLAAPVAMLLLAASPFAFVYSRLAILDTFVVFQFCVLLLIASYAGERRWLALGLLTVLLPTIVLTKATALVLLPAAIWLAWHAMRGNTSVKMRVGLLLAVELLAVLLFRAYVACVFWRGYGEDYNEFFAANSLEPFHWSGSIANLLGIVKSCMWIDGIVYPLAMASLLFAAIRLRGLWRDPLFTGCCIAMAGQGAFLFRTENNYAPRYFLPLLMPMAAIVALTVAELRARGWKLAWVPIGAVAIAVIWNTVQIASSLRHSTSEFYDASQAIAKIVAADPRQSRLMLGVSASEISLMTGLPAITDVYGTIPLAQKVSMYRPGWYLGWNGIGPNERAALAGCRIEKVASYHAFDDDERDELILYKLIRDKR